MPLFSVSTGLVAQREKVAEGGTYVVNVRDIVGQFVKHDAGGKDPERARVEQSEEEELVVGPALSSVVGVGDRSQVSLGRFSFSFAERKRERERETDDATSSEPGTVVIHLEDAAPTCRAVVSAIRFRDVALSEGKGQLLGRGEEKEAGSLPLSSPCDRIGPTRRS